MVIKILCENSELIKTLASGSIKLRAAGSPVPLLSPVVESNLVVNWLIRFLRFELVSA